MTNDLSVSFKQDFLPDHEALFSALDQEVAWESRIKKRRTASFGVPFNYSGQVYDPVPMPPALEAICDRIEEEVGFRPNNCLLNYYGGGGSKMGFHVDATDHLSPGTGVVIVSLGADRSLTFRRIEDHEHTQEFRLTGGSLIFMPNEVQESWQHAVLKEPGAGPRISLTFRKVEGH